MLRVHNLPFFLAAMVLKVEFTFPWAVNRRYRDDTVADVHKDILRTVQTVHSTR